MLYGIKPSGFDKWGVTGSPYFGMAETIGLWNALEWAGYGNKLKQTIAKQHTSILGTYLNCWTSAWLDWIDYLTKGVNNEKEIT